jgi:hypothetical protein
MANFFKKLVKSVFKLNAAVFAVAMVTGLGASKDAAVGLAKLILKDENKKNSANTNGLLLTVQNINVVATADAIRDLKINETDTGRAIADTLTNKGAGNVVNQIAIENTSRSIPANFNTANGIVASSFQVIIPEKKFYSNIIGFSSNVNALDSFVNTTLNTNNVYATSNITTSSDYTINNGYLDSYIQVSSRDLDLSPHTKGVADLAEENLAKLKTAFLTNNFLN